jgi:hypothetical protein
MSDHFVIGGVGFRMKPIPVLDSEKVYRHLAPILTPLVTLAAANMTLTPESLKTAMGSMPEAIEQLPKLHDFFVKWCQVQLPNEYNGGWLDLENKTFCEKAFPPRSHSRHFEWIARCIVAEYGTFLFELWEQAKDHMAQTESPSSSPSGSTGTSGESPSADA